MDDAILEQAVAIGVKLADHRLIRSSEGNLSLRRDENSFLITPSGSKIHALNQSDFVAVEFDGSHSKNHRPSSEWRFHQDIYRTQGEAQAIIHTHSEYATALACLREDLPAFHYMVAIAGGDRIKCCDYALFGSEELSSNILAALEDRKACLIANHGLIAWGRSLDEAYTIALEIESLCKQYLIARSTGLVCLLSDEEMQQVIEKFQDYRINKLQFESKGVLNG